MKQKYRSRFPQARIKKIMQTDEDVGKLGSAVPAMVSKALELFLQSLLDASIVETRLHAEKAATATVKTDDDQAEDAPPVDSRPLRLICHQSHLKRCIERSEKFDFLKDLVKEIPSPDDVDVSLIMDRGRKRGRSKSHNLSVESGDLPAGRKDGVDLDPKSAGRSPKPRAARTKASKVKVVETDASVGVRSEESVIRKRTSNSKIAALMNDHDEEPPVSRQRTGAGQSSLSRVSTGSMDTVSSSANGDESSMTGGRGALFSTPHHHHPMLINDTQLGSQSLPHVSTLLLDSSSAMAAGSSASANSVKPPNSLFANAGKAPINSPLPSITNNSYSTQSAAASSAEDDDDYDDV